MKPKDQVSIHTFWGAVDPLFRPLSEEDRLFLLEKGDNVKPYIIPPLGRHYSQVWADEDKRYGIPPSLDENSFNDSISQSSKKPFTKGSASTKRADAMMRGAHRGNLIDRLLSSLVQEDIVDESSLLHESNTTHTPTEEAKGSGSGDLQVWPCESYDIINLEERMRRELRYVGLLSADEIDFDAQEDDEICAELRAAGRELQKQVKENEFRKARLLDIVDQQLQYEQYRQMLEKLNSQVEQSYMKRFRTHTSKKRKTASSAKINAAYAMQRRNTWINSLDDIFRNKNLILPEESIYKQQD
ncbi:histone acetyltransferases subunit 3-domain-containing protein [Radiomyces spectabilis]|uniref:histone acetyltransferases subunit 3-domain-containing protein n=1 Tax=Radiomyces spectabilis TaxID=64574 RepID=UPI002220E8DF|nr:histone acetyltransferases subunit 3-domain-containing protein [Radiomyces spectabilis]KAI8391199.1 histone acetyltransferases subunit 3-domain-containing protein [Radiomyces spectabilis]